MSWRAGHRIGAFRRSSLWLGPVACMALALVVAPVARALDERTRWTLLGFGPDGARAVLGALSSALLTFIVVAFSILLLAVQVAGGQLSPRIIARVFERRITKAVLSAFVFTFVYSLADLGRVEDRAPQLPVLLAILASLASVALFIALVQAVSQGFRPIAVLTGVGADTRAVIETLYPHPFTAGAAEPDRPDLDRAPAPRTIAHHGRSGVLVGFDRAGLVEIARRADGVIELVPAVGDFVAQGEDLFRVHGARLHGAGAAAVHGRSLVRCVELGPERTLDQDPAFGIRILVDIASKALSPAINDPTTGALAVDQIQPLLRALGERRLDEGLARDAAGVVRLVHPTPDWEDFVTLGVTEIRLYGATSPQVTRRLVAMLEQLASVLPAERAVAPRRELALLQRTIERSHADPDDRATAARADRQGLGSRQKSR